MSPNINNSLIAPTVDIRSRIPQSTIQELVNRIVTKFNPERIILFGSYANGTFQPESDVDLLIIMKTNLREVQQALQIRQFIKPLFGVDILVYQPDQLEKRIELGDYFLQEVISNGIVIYESSNQ